MYESFSKFVTLWHVSRQCVLPCVLSSKELDEHRSNSIFFLSKINIHEMQSLQSDRSCLPQTKYSTNISNQTIFLSHHNFYFVEFIGLKISFIVHLFFIILGSFSTVFRNVFTDRVWVFVHSVGQHASKTPKLSKRK